MPAGRLPTVRESREVWQLGESIGADNIKKYASIRATCMDCANRGRGLVVLAAMWWNGRPLVTTLERGDRLDHRKLIGPFWDFYMLDQTPVAHARCRKHRYLFDAATLRAEMPVSGGDTKVFPVWHDQHGGILR